MKGGAELSIVVLGVAVAYLLIVVAGAIGALLVLIWHFQETPGATGETERPTIKGPRSADRSGAASTFSALDDRERTKNKAA